MSNLPALNELSKEQVDLIKATVAKNASDDELKLFLYRCAQMNLDPLKPGQIYFIKYGTSPGSMVVGLDGFRAKAEASGKHTGTKRGIIRDDKGVALGAWCEVYRKDWIEPAREEVSLKEYNTGKSQWSKMPETMIKKVAEVAALRMAFPDLLSGLYSQEEMDQAEVAAKPVKETRAVDSQEVPHKEQAVTTKNNELDAKMNSHKEDVKELEVIIKENNKEVKKEIKNFAQDALITDEQAAKIRSYAFSKGYDEKSLKYSINQVCGVNEIELVKVSQLNEIRAFLKG